MAEITLHEVGFRDGLQMEHQTVPFETKLSWIERMFSSGVDVVQVGSFVHPTKVPQMADTDRLFTEIRSRGSRPDWVTLSALVLNEKGLDRGLACGAELFCMGVSASETHSNKNTGMSVEEATGRIIRMAQSAEAAGARVQLSVQSAFGCGYEGPVPHERVLEIMRRYLEAGFHNFSLADTAGHADPEAVETLYQALFALDKGITAACHFHNTYGLALANCIAAQRSGVQSFESSVAGLGGCPFTKVAGGNTCTEDLIHLIQRRGIRKDIDLQVLTGVASDIAAFFGREMAGMVYRTGPIPEFQQA